MPYSEDLCEGDPGTRRVYGAFGGEMPPDMVEHIDRLRARRERAERLSAARSSAPLARKVPRTRTRNPSAAAFVIGPRRPAQG